MKTTMVAPKKDKCCHSLSYIRTGKYFLIERRAKMALKAILDGKDVFTLFPTEFSS